MHLKISQNLQVHDLVNEIVEHLLQMNPYSILPQLVTRQIYDEFRYHRVYVKVVGGYAHLLVISCSKFYVPFAVEDFLELFALDINTIFIS